MPPMLIRADGGSATASVRLDSLDVAVPGPQAFNVSASQLRDADQVSVTF